MKCSVETITHAETKKIIMELILNILLLIFYQNMY